MTISIQSRISLCLNSVVELFKANPFEFLYERELQAILYSSLKSAITESIHAPVEIHRDRLEKEWIPINLIRAEYPCVTKTISQFDIAVIHLDSTRKASRYEGQLNDAFWNQNLFGAIELKYLQIGYENNLRRELNGFWKDIEKLRRYPNPEGLSVQFRLALLFIQSFNDSMLPIIYKYMETKHVTTRVVNKIDDVSDMEAYIVSPSATYKLEGFT